MTNRKRNRKMQLKFKKYLRNVDLAEEDFKPQQKPWK